mgnify:CR=1 FL=1
MANWVYNEIQFDRESACRKVWDKCQAAPGEDEDVASGSAYRFTTQRGGEDRFAFDTEYNEGESIYFSTKWAPPEEFYRWLRETFPEQRISIRWEEEQGFGEEFVLEGGEIHDYVEWSYPEFDIKYGDIWGWMVFLERDDDPTSNVRSGYYLCKFNESSVDLMDFEYYCFEDLPQHEDVWGPFDTEREAKQHIKEVLKQQLIEATPTVK